MVQLQAELQKVVSFGCFGIPGCITYAITADLGPEESRPPEGWRWEGEIFSLTTGRAPLGGRFAQLEGPTAYLGHDFSAVSYVNLTSGRWLYTSLSSPPHLATRVVGEPRGEECDLPVIIHTEDREHALGVISPPRSPPWTPS